VEGVERDGGLRPAGDGDQLPVIVRRAVVVRRFRQRGMVKEES
jgi:hypothetical protein